MNRRGWIAVAGAAVVVVVVLALALPRLGGSDPFELDALPAHCADPATFEGDAYSSLAPEDLCTEMRTVFDFSHPGVVVRYTVGRTSVTRIESMGPVPPPFEDVADLVRGSNDEASYPFWNTHAPFLTDRGIDPEDVLPRGDQFHWIDGADYLWIDVFDIYDADTADERAAYLRFSVSGDVLTIEPQSVRVGPKGSLAIVTADDVAVFWNEPGGEDTTVEFTGAVTGW